jgi:export-related chaperone CsaA
MQTIEWSDFDKVELRIGTIIDVEDFPEARKPAYKLKVDFGEEIGIKKSSAQITDIYDRQTLIGTQVLGVVNLWRGCAGKTGISSTEWNQIGLASVSNYYKTITYYDKLRENNAGIFSTNHRLGP